MTETNKELTVDIFKRETQTAILVIRIYGWKHIYVVHSFSLFKFPFLTSLLTSALFWFYFILVLLLL
jgi:hypothetical protein